MKNRTIAWLLAAALCSNSMLSVVYAQEVNAEKQQNVNEEVPKVMPDGEMSPGQMPDGQPPAKPDGEMAQGERSDGQPPEMPDGERPQGQMPDGQPPAKPGEDGGMGGPGGPGEMASGVDSYTAVKEYTEDAEVESEEISSVGTDENAVLVSDGARVQVSKSDISRASEESKGGDTSSFYGVGAAVLVTDGVVNVDDSTINTNAGCGAGVFAYGDGVAYVSDTTINTDKGTSGGIHVAGGGTLYANNLNVTTQGESSAAIRSDRGGGTMVVDGGSYTSNGTGSNGADSSFTAINQEMQGDVIWDSISTLRLNVTEGSSFTGAVIDDETNAGNGGNGSCSLVLDESSIWTVTADSVLTDLNTQGTIQDVEGNTVTIQDSDGTVYVEGNSAYTIIVDSYTGV